MPKPSRATRIATEVIARELQNRGGVDAGSAVSLAEHLIATLDREDFMIVRRPDDLRDALKLTRKLEEEAKRKAAPSTRRDRNYVDKPHPFAPMMGRVLDLDRHAAGPAVGEPVSAHGHPVVCDDHDVRRLSLPSTMALSSSASITTPL